MGSTPRDVLGHQAIALGLLPLLSACAVNERAETVYLYQHRTTAALTEAIVVSETADPALAERLYATEAELDTACGPLREAGYRELTGEAVDGDLEWAVYQSLDACAAKTTQVEALLREIDPETANYFLGAPVASERSASDRSASDPSANDVATIGDPN